MIVDDFVEFENNSKVLEYKYHYKDIIIWPYIRDVLINKVVCIQCGILPYTGLRAKENKYRDYVKYNTFKLPKRDILFFSPSGAVIESKGQIYDRLIDGFVGIAPDASAKIMLHSKEFDLKKLGKAGIPFTLDSFIEKIISCETQRIKHPIPKEEQQVINQLICYLKRELPFEVEEGIYEGIKKSAEYILKAFPFYYKYYGKLIDIVQPKLIVYHAATYGLMPIRVFRDYGIVTAEYQHGSIDNQWTYRYGEKIATNLEYRKHMPDYFLTWGDYWTRNVNLPTTVCKIGNPEVQKNIDKFKKMKTDTSGQFTVLIVPESDYQWCVEFIDYLLKNLPEKFKIIVKIHPLLPDHIQYYEKFLVNKRVKVACSGSIYDYFALCKYVVGDMSTAMYEAAAMGKDVFVVANNELTISCMNGGFATLLYNGQQFVEEINKQKENKFDSEDFFDSNWKENYKNFLKKVL